MSAARRKGTTFESAVVAVFVEGGFPHVERRALAGALDKGDLAGLPGVVVECKATKAASIGEHMREAEVERVNAGADFGVLVWKRPRVAVRDAAAVLPLWQLVQLLKEAGR